MPAHKGAHGFRRPEDCASGAGVRAPGFGLRPVVRGFYSHRRGPRSPAASRRPRLVALPGLESLDARHPPAWRPRHRTRQTLPHRSGRRGPLRGRGSPRDRAVPVCGFPDGQPASCPRSDPRSSRAMPHRRVGLGGPDARRSRPVIGCVQPGRSRPSN